MELPTTQMVRASATMNSSGAVALSNNQLFLFAREATFIIYISAKSGTLNFNVALQSSTDGITFDDSYDLGNYSVNGTFRVRVDGHSYFGKYQQLYITRTGGTCTLKIEAEMIEVI